MEKSHSIPCAGSKHVQSHWQGNHTHAISLWCLLACNALEEVEPFVFMVQLETATKKLKNENNVCLPTSISLC